MCFSITTDTDMNELHALCCIRCRYARIVARHHKKYIHVQTLRLFCHLHLGRDDDGHDLVDTTQRDLPLPLSWTCVCVNTGSYDDAGYHQWAR